MQNCPHCGKSLEVVRPPSVENLLWFDAFWQLYPRHVGKASALKAWKKAATSEAIKDEIMAALKCQLAGMLKRDKSFIPHASTWLNGKRWEDDPQPISALNRAPRVIACPDCADTGIAEIEGRLGHYARCSCNRGALPGLVIPQAEDCPF